MIAPTVPNSAATSANPGYSASSNTTAAVLAIPAMTAGAIQRSHLSSALESIRGSSWYSIGEPMP